MPPANRFFKRQRIPKSIEVLLAVRTFIREKRAKNERVVAHHVLDLMRSSSTSGLLTNQTPKLMPMTIASFFFFTVRARGLLRFNTVIVVSKGKELICTELGFSLEIHVAIFPLLCLVFIVVLATAC